jgi:hypothetical protein
VFAWLVGPWRDEIQIPRFTLLGVALVVLGYVSVFVLSLTVHGRETLNTFVVSALVMISGGLLAAVGLVVGVVRGVRSARARTSV